MSCVLRDGLRRSRMAVDVSYVFFLGGGGGVLGPGW